MRVIRPIQITDASFVSSTVAENDATAYSLTTTYGVGERVLYGHRVYTSLQASNLNHTPGDALSSTWWSDQGASNQWAMFDGEVGTPTVAAGSLTVVLRPGMVDSIALLGVLATAVTATLTVDGETAWEMTQSMVDNREVVDGYTYCFSPIRLLTKLIRIDLPPYSLGELTVTLSAPSGNVSCGMMICGNAMLIGSTEYGASPGIDDYSRVEFDAYGVSTLVKRNFSPNQTATVWAENASLDSLYAQMADLRATPCVWIGADTRFECLTMYGIYKSFKPVIQYPDYSVCSIEIKGML